jgi:predicted nucleotidyltransferase
VADDSLRTLARHLDVPERTLRRAAAEGLVHGRRISERRFKTALREESYLREHWPLLRALRGALRTEPNVRLAVLFGSVAVGQETAGSDIDLFVRLRDVSAPAVASLAQRLSDRVRRDVQLVRVEEAEHSAALMVMCCQRVGCSSTATSHGRSSAQASGGGDVGRLPALYRSRTRSGISSCRRWPRLPRRLRRTIRTVRVC